MKFQSATVISDITQEEQLDNTISFLVAILSSICEFRDLESGEHVKRIQAYTNIMIRKVMNLYPEYGITEADCKLITTASALHDIGKIVIPDEILMKPGKLTSDEFAEVKRHTLYGCEILDRFVQYEDEFYRYCFDICKYHHERWDGKGYPEGLIGEKIPIWAHIVGIADVYDALVNQKIYRGAVEREKAVSMILNGNCGVFNPKVMECFKASLKEFEAV